MTDHCPDCGRPFVIAHEGAIETHCLANRKDDFLGRVMCKDNTIARLRLELAAAKAASELSTAERATLAAAIELRRVHSHATWTLLFLTVDALLALRAQKAEG